jgi:hypothetical protein
MFGYSFGSEHLSKMASEILINGPINIFPSHICCTMSIQEQVKLWMAMINEKDFCYTAFTMWVQVVLQHVDKILYLLSYYFKAQLCVLPVRDVASRICSMQPSATYVHMK